MSDVASTKTDRDEEEALMRLMGLAAMMAIALVGTAVPALAQTDRAAERAQYVVLNAERALYQAQNARQDADRTAVQAEGNKDEEKEGTNAVAQEMAAATIPESGDISVGDIALSALGGGALLIGAWLIACRATR